jgi:hypothetical protein
MSGDIRLHERHIGIYSNRDVYLIVGLMRKEARDLEQPSDLGESRYEKD